MNVVKAEMSATVWKLAVEDGTTVMPGDTIAILESMKMEIPVLAESSGSVQFRVTEGADIAEGAVLAEIE